MMKQVSMLYLFCLLVGLGSVQGQSWQELNNLGISAFKLSNYEKASILFEKAKEQALIEFGKNHRNYGEALNNLAASYRERGLYKKAESLYKKALPTIKTASGKKSPDYALALDGLGKVYMRDKHYDKAEALYIQVLKDYKVSSLGIRTTNYTVFLERLILLYTQPMNKLEEAEALLKEHFPLYKKTFPEDHPEFKLFMRICQHYYDKELIKTPHDYLLQRDYLMLKIKQFTNKSKNYLKHSNLLGVVYLELGVYNKAEVIFKEVVNLHLQYFKENRDNYITYLNNLIVALLYQGKYADADNLIVKLNNLLLNHAGNLQAQVMALNTIGSFYSFQGVFAKAEDMYKKSLKLVEDNLGKNTSYYATLLSNIGLLYFDQRLYDKASIQFKKALNLRKKNLGENHPDYVLSLHNLAAVYDVQGLHNKALDLYTKVGLVRQKMFGRHSISYALYLNNIARVYFKKNVFAKAEENYKEALKIITKQVHVYNPHYLNTLGSLAYVYYFQKKYEQAKSYYLKMIDTYLYLVSNLNHFSESYKKQYLKKNKKHFYNFSRFIIDYLQQNPQEQELLVKFVNFRIATKSQLLNNKRKLFGLLEQSSNKTLIKKTEKYKLLRFQLANSISLNKDVLKTRNIDIDKDMATIQILETELFKAVNITSSTKDKLLLSDVKSTIGAQDAVIEIVRLNIYKGDYEGSEKRTLYLYILIKRGSIKPEVVVKEDASIMDQTFIKQYQKAIQAKQRDTLSYKVFWSPIDSLLKGKGIKKVYLSPDGVYHQLNLNTLQNPVTGKYVGEEIELHLVNSLKDIVKFKNQKTSVQANNHIQLFARPAYDLPIEDLKQAETALNTQVISSNTTTPLSAQEYQSGKQTLRSGWSDLPGTEAEIRAIEKVLLEQKKYQVVTRLKEQALEKAVKNVASPKVLHIATHGFFVENFKAPTKVQKEEVVFDNFSRGGTAMNMTALRAKITREEPMLRSGLVLAGASSYEKAVRKPNTEDGILTAYEASALDLQNTDLVTLSACETGLGEIENGEGVYGLQRAFMVAGAKSLLMSLWKVDDTATQLLMSRFYQEWIGKGKSKRAAFRAAQTYLRNYKKAGKKIYEAPYYWGAFVMVGE